MFRKSRPFFLKFFCILGAGIFGVGLSRADVSGNLRTSTFPSESFSPRLSSEFPPSLLRSLNQTIEFINEDSRSLPQEKKLKNKKQGFAQNNPNALIVLPTKQSEWVSWIQKRIKIFFFEDDNLFSKIRAEPRADAYPFFPETAKRVQDLGTQSPLPPMTSRMATHAASDLYLKAKLSSQFFTLESPDFGSLPLLSPRAGWVVVFRDLFSSRRSVNFVNPNAESNLISRAAVLFHEARHSDGYGKYVGFMHVPCPPGHEAAGIAACDDVANGAFRASAEYLEKKIATCRRLREAEKQALGILLLDQLNRLTRMEDLPRADDAPESLNLKESLSEHL